MLQDTNLLVITRVFTFAACSAQDVSICEIPINTKVDITPFSASLHLALVLLGLMF